jgi:hypothetical protein
LVTGATAAVNGAPACVAGPLSAVTAEVTGPASPSLWLESTATALVSRPDPTDDDREWEADVGWLAGAFVWLDVLVCDGPTARGAAVTLGTDDVADVWVASPVVVAATLESPVVASVISAAPADATAATGWRRLVEVGGGADEPDVAAEATPWNMSDTTKAMPMPSNTISGRVMMAAAPPPEAVPVRLIIRPMPRAELMKR